MSILFSDFLENCVELLRSLSTVLRRLGALWNGCMQEVGDFLITFPSEGT